MASTAPRPRPRPVPRVKPTPAASSSENAPPRSAIPVVVDDDAMFMRNTGRSANTWKKLDKMTKAKPKTARSESEGDSDSPPPKKQKKKAPGGDAQDKINRLLSEALSDDSDSDVVEVTNESGTPTKKGKNKKRRSRSRSITPPPMLPKHTLQLARDLVRKTLDTARPPSPIHYDEADESTDTIVFDPELQKIAHSVAAEAQRAYSEPVESDPTDTLEITVNWQPHPLNEAGKATQVVFKLNRSDNFHELFEAVAEDESILVESLIMSYKGARLYPSVTPAALRLWGDAELVACDKSTWEYLRTHPAASALDPEPDVPDTDAPSPGHSNAEESEAESDAGGETFKLCLRSAVTTKDITVTVRPTTTCGAIVTAFLKKAGLADKYGKGGRKSIGGAKGKGKKGDPSKEPHLVVDGDKMAPDAPIGDAGLDDGDVVDVVGL
ncbi:hypothetical protein B0H11DRAFT_1138409 [Mycena galericulata]|nr:hypothetical protein B0H11DRAFT_1138409 [Mycena galericulata]